MSSEDSSKRGSRRIGLATVAGAVTAALALGLAVGWWFGQQSAPLIQIVETECADPCSETLVDAAGPGASDSVASNALESSLLMGLRLAAHVNSLEDLIDELGRENVEPREAVRRLIGQMNDDDLTTVISLAMRFGEDELAEVEDIRAFATRLADIAIEGTLEEAPDPDEAEEPMGAVLFSTVREEDDPESVAMDSFFENETEIFAHYPLPPEVDERLMLQWSRVDKPQMMVFRRHTPRRAGAYSVMSVRRGNGFAPGTYRVAIYQGDEEMAPLASGMYVVKALPE